jgi:NADPH:quinone reductase
MLTKQIVLASRPAGEPYLDNFRFEDVDLPELQSGDVLLNGLYYSVDPYMRGRMNDARSYIPPFQLGLPIEGGVVGVVSKTKSENFRVGDKVVSNLPWRKDIITSAKGLTKIDASVVPASYYLGVLGMPGLTAYFGLMYIGKPKMGETVVVSGAAGAVGVVVGQIAKIHGCRVIGIAGTDDKVKLLRNEFGFDDAINYRATKYMEKAIQAACPNGVDIYFDNVGGEISDAVIANMNVNGRIPLCGQISLYNIDKPIGPRLQPLLLTKSALMQGFIISNYQSHFPEGIQHLTEWIISGQLKFTETIIKGFNQLPAAFIGLFKGENTGKMVIEV